VPLRYLGLAGAKQGPLAKKRFNPPINPQIKP
jgi:hypothetical protein